MVVGAAVRRGRGAVLAVVALGGVALATACDPLDDAEPTVASVNFEPRLVITVGDDGITGAAGAREGAERLTGDDVGWRVTSGTVTDLVNDAADDRRVVVTVTPLEDDGSDPAPWLDTGTMEPGESTVVALTRPGTYRFDDVDRGGPDPELTVQVVPRSAP